MSITQANLTSVSIDVAAKMLEIAIKNFQQGTVSSHTNVCLHGSPGLGKSSIVRQVAQKLGMKLIDLRLSAMQESDVLGIPYTVNGIMKFSTPEWWPEDDGWYILFLDELKSAPAAVQTAAYRLILDRSIQNGKVLSKKVFIVAAGNMKEDRTGAKDMLPAAANRFGLHLTIDKNKALEPFLDYAMRNGFSRDLVGFLSWKREAIYGDIGVEAAFPTPRTWEEVNKHLSIPEFANDLELLQIAVAGAVGNEYAMHFTGYMENSKYLPDWKAIRTGQSGYKYDFPTGNVALEFSLSVSAAFELLSIFPDAPGGSIDEEYLKRLVDVVISKLQREMLITMFRTCKRDMRKAGMILQHPLTREYWNQVRSAITGKG